ncbi:putative pentatricopeptide repeat-containing protein At5g37570 [Arachis duranensis]|uniref:Pentatricopeptide repeat-containing protein At5g37570 n=1 Tax=Arachis duranensis TaxID=130453 RepID=A0A6P4DG40_ARADU|nr:putative pentatricopeptide repeat-containing protein At5g37570 [Arachis duranensis]
MVNLMIIIYLCMKFYTGTASLHSQPPKASPLLTQFLNTSTTILHLKQTQAFALKLLSHQPHQYNHFLGRLFLRIFYLNAEISNLCYAHKLFDEMPNCPNSFLWTSLIRAFISGTQFRHGISTYARMHQNGVLPSEFTYSTVLNACGRIPATFEGTQVHARVVQSGFLGNKFVQTALLDMYAKFGSVFDARVVFDGMCDRDLVAWTAMICGYAKAGMMIHARWLFDNMGEKNSFTWTTMVAGYANSGDMKSAKKLYDAMDEENKSVVTWVAMIAGYGKFGKVSEAKRVFDRISTPRDPSACAAMLACYAQNGYAKEAIDMYKEMRQSKIKITEVAMVGALSACAQLRDIQMSSTLTEHVEESIYDRICIISNSLIHMHSKCGNINLAWTEFSRMKYRDVYSYSAMIAAFAEHGKSQDAIDLFLKMQKEGLQPNQVTFVGLLNACSSSALIDEGCRYFRTMTEVFGIQPLPEHYACMVDLLGRAGQLERAYCLIKQNASADATTWGSLLAACRVYGNVELGETAARHLTMIDPEDSGNYVLLANTYASKDKWEHAEEVRKFMSEKGMKKPSGHSWIQREISGQFRDEIF